MKPDRILHGMFRNNSGLISRRSVWAAKFGSSPSGTVGTGTLTLVNPVSYQVFQRNVSGYGDIAINGTYSGSPGALEASFDGGAWSIIQQEPTGGTFSGTLTGQAAGQGTLSVRWRGNPDSVITRTLVGVGDIFIIGGQSSAVGMTASNQSYSHATLKACMFANDYNWKELADPVDSNTGQVDAVSSDSGIGGSYYPLLATTYLASQGVPCAFVPCAKVGTKAIDWQPGTNHQDRTTLYGSMVYRTLQAGGARCVLWWQGESDVVDGTDPSTYNSYLDTIANTFYSDTGVKLMICMLEDLSRFWSGFDETAINNAIYQAWQDNSNVIPGPDLHLFQTEDGGHYSSADAPTVRDYWWNALKTAFGWSD